MAATRSGTPLQPGDVIPWDPAGKLDDEVERRTAGPAPATGGTPGALGETVSPNRYAGATDAAPTSPPAGATTTLGGMTGTEAAAELSGAPGYFPSEEAPSGYPEGHGEVY